MKTAVGDRIRIHGRTVGAPERQGVVKEVHGTDASPLLTVMFDDGHETILAPGADCEITHAD
ncbi:MULTISPECIES: DUF1918 domain-containing protein [unclassified Microbacterium]|uniref:DUF1918 domain-containing protein n=1 Tax=unclassified Microbacterium TaxID=2609290 RepID=UPI00214AB692|nr:MULTISPECIES: DUF1918 domain-containing protein [unclassified Microbacterium]MCR2784323.1 DUF1918 domain-containing protein [Microbacterium sp. zg.B96]MDL5350769.1 DUF1918 domain-containing protein [Microbacterium sp. zg-YB36]WIM14850.1 DUF1918 domain-containing protein [Microbacterium sp. zg-B96]